MIDLLSASKKSEHIRLRADGTFDASQRVAVDEMLEYMYNKDKKSEHIDKNLPYILQKTCFVHGSRDLFDEYDGKVKEFLKVHGESRAIKMLWEGCVEIDYVDYSRREYKTEGNISQFALHSHDLKGRIFNIKTEILIVKFMEGGKMKIEVSSTESV